MKAFLAAFVRHTVFANIILVLIFLVGFMATRSMVREAFPQFAIDLILVNVAYPGADPEEVEEGISRKIEEALEDIEGIKQIGTESREGSALATIEVKKGYDSADVLDRVRNRINAISTFPIDAERPTIEEFILKDPVLMLALTGDMSEMRMKEWAERLKDELQQLPAISQVQIMGTRPYEIGIEIAEERLREYRLTFDDVVGAIRRNNLTLAGGTLRTADEEIRIRTLGRKYTGEALSHIAVVTRPSGEVITLGQLGTIVDGFTEDPIMSQVNGQQAVFLSIMKTSEEDALKIAKATHTFLKRKALELPDGVGVYPVYDWSVMLKARIRLLVKNGLIGLTFVFLLLWLFLDLRLSFWAGMGMPISVAGALGILWAVGGTINMISLFGLIMVLGIIVDDAIVVGESIYVHRANGLGPVDAAVEGLREVGMPVIAAVLTTIIAFLPLSFLGGIMGKFISILPVVVIACLLVSLLECLLLLPAHLGHMNDQAPKRIKGEPNRMQRFADAMHRFSSGGLERFVKGPYARFADHVIANRYLVLCISIAVLFVTAGLLHSGLIKTSFFPAFDGFIITATAEFPDGTPLDVTRRAVEHLEASAERMAARLQTQSGDPLIDYRIALIGQTIGVGGKVGSNVGSLQLVLLDAEKRGIPSKTIIVEWEKEIGSLAGVEALTFEEMEAGPPGAPIEVWLQGMSIEQVVAASEDLQAELNNFNGVYQVHSDFRKGRTEIRLKLKPEASVLGLDVSDLANQMFAGYFGAETVRLQRGRDDIRVRVRYPAEERQRLTDLERIRIRTRSGAEVPLLSVADIEFAPGYTSISRKDGMRNVAVLAQVDTAVANTREISEALESSYFPLLRTKYPSVYVSVQGEKKRMAESMGGLKFGFPLAILGIFIVVATVFRSYVQPLIILVTVPFGILGAVYGHMVMGLELSIMSMFGMVALTGVVVNDAIVLIECVNRNLAEGMDCFEAIREGGVRRFRPVLLTSLSTVGGLTPMIIETDFQAQFLIPMALSLAAGVAFATVITLVLIPGLLAILNDGRRFYYRLRYGQQPTRELVEPASSRHDLAEVL